MDKKSVEIFRLFEDENQREYNRRKKMTAEERCREFSILQARRWGKDWASKSIEKIVSYEKIF
jgi:hypothetical protein